MLRGEFSGVIGKLLAIFGFEPCQEVLAASMRAIESGQLILGLNTTVHYESYKKLPTVLASSDLLLEKIKDVLQSPEEFTNRIEEQRVILQLARKEDLLAFFNCRGEEAK